LAPIMGIWYRTRRTFSAEQQMKIQARIDQLTGLANKVSFLKTVERHLATMNPDDAQCALVVCEISDLPVIDQNFGQQAAEFVTLATANRLVELKPEKCELASLDRGRFALFLHSVTDAMKVLTLAKDVTTSLSQPAEWRDERLSMQVHAGIGLSSSDGDD